MFISCEYAERFNNSLYEITEIATIEINETPSMTSVILVENFILFMYYSFQLKKAGSYANEYTKYVKILTITLPAQSFLKHSVHFPMGFPQKNCHSLRSLFYNTLKEL